jgi:hypothetical protein
LKSTPVISNPAGGPRPCGYAVAASGSGRAPAYFADAGTFAASTGDNFL